MTSPTESSAQWPYAPGDVVKARQGTHLALSVGEARGWIHSEDRQGYWVLWESGHDTGVLGIDLEPTTATEEERRDFHASQRLEWEHCDYFLNGHWLTMPAINPFSRPRCDRGRCAAHRDPEARDEGREFTLPPLRG